MTMVVVIFLDVTVKSSFPLSRTLDEDELIKSYIRRGSQDDAEALRKLLEYSDRDRWLCVVILCCRYHQRELLDQVLANSNTSLAEYLRNASKGTISRWHESLFFRDAVESYLIALLVFCTCVAGSPKQPIYLVDTMYVRSWNPTTKKVFREIYKMAWRKRHWSLTEIFRDRVDPDWKAKIQRRYWREADSTP